GGGFMPQRMRSRRPYLWVAALSVAVGLALFALPSARAITPAEGDAQVNDTPSKLLPCIQKNDLWKYMQDFQAIADANPSPADGHPSRNSGEPGYKASADYVANLMTEWGYDVTIQTYKFDYFAYTGTPTFSEPSPIPHDYALPDEWKPGASLGTASADLQPAGGIIIPPTESPSSSSGCTAGVFRVFFQAQSPRSNGVRSTSA